jgi:hypothetical protein
MTEHENDNPYSTGDSGGPSGTWSKPFEWPPGSGSYVMQHSGTGERRPVDTPPPDITPILNALKALGAIPLGNPALAGPENRARGIWPQGPDPNAQWDAAAADPMGAFQLPNGRLFSTNDAMASLLKLSGMNDGSGGGITAYQSAQLARQAEQDAYEKEQDKVALAINILKTLADEAQAADQRAQYGQQNRLEALKYMIDPNQQFIPGFEPGAYNTRMGLTSALSVPHTRFNPDLPPNPYTGQVSSGLARLQALAG